MPETETLERPPMSEARAVALREPEMRWLDMPREQLVSTLNTSLYPGAKPESVKAVLDYCEAARLNVMLKPVHIVPMSVKLPNGKYEYRDVVMPGINHYRTQASRTNQYLGKSEPEWGPMVEKSWGEFKLTVPEWCKVTVRRLVGGQVAEFTALEYWDENYATKGRDSSTPNAMWQKRPRGQLHKCTEAQALRIAFPELISDVTAEEMEGKTIDLTRDDIDGVHKQAAVRSLDDFASRRDEPEVAGGDRTPSSSEPEDAEVEEIDDETGEVKIDDPPIMPDDAYGAFYAPVEGAKPNWQPGYKWLNETLEANAYTDGVKTLIGQRYADLLWAVHDVGGKQQKAVLAFVERHGIFIPPKKGANASAK